MTIEPMLLGDGLPEMIGNAAQNFNQYNSALPILYNLFDGFLTHAIGAADWTPLLPDRLWGGYILGTGTGSHNVIFPASVQFRKLFVNASGHAQTIKIGSSTGYSLASGAAEWLYADGTDVFSAGGGGAVSSVAGRTGAVTLSDTDISGLGTAALVDVPATGNATAGQAVLGNDTRLGSAGVFVRAAYVGSGNIASTTNLAQANSASGIALVLPQASAYGVGMIWLQNINTGTATFSAHAGDTIDSGTVTIASGAPSVMLVGDGINGWTSF